MERWSSKFRLTAYCIAQEYKQEVVLHDIRHQGKGLLDILRPARCKRKQSFDFATCKVVSSRRRSALAERCLQLVSNARVWCQPAALAFAQTSRSKSTSSCLASSRRTSSITTIRSAASRLSCRTVFLSCSPRGLRTMAMRRAIKSIIHSSQNPTSTFSTKVREALSEIVA